MTSLILSHHRPNQYDRCIKIGRHHVCRRCAVLYPLAFAVAIASLFGLHWPETWDRALLYLLPLPVTLEFVIERFGGVRYRPCRQVALTLLAAPAFGRGRGTAPGVLRARGRRDPFGGGAVLSLLISRAADAADPNRR